MFTGLDFGAYSEEISRIFAILDVGFGYQPFVHVKTQAPFETLDYYFFLKKKL